MKVTHFKSAQAFRTWLLRNHHKANELHVGFYRKGSGRAGLTYPEAVEEALCFGWIDGIVHRIDDVSYSHRFTPRKPGSIWSNTNVAHVNRLKQEGRMHAAGLAAFAARSAARTGVYSFEQRTPARLPADCKKCFQADPAAWKFFQAQAPWYRRLITHKIATAKQPATRERWLSRAIEASAAGRRIE